MSFRTRAFLVLLAAVLVPLAVLAVGVRRELSGLVGRERAERVEEARAALDSGLERERGRIEARLARIAADLADDSRFRLAVGRDDPAARAWLLDQAGAAMRSAELDLLQLQDAGGTILSSGHFRNEYDRAGLPAAATYAGEPAFVLRARTADGTIVAFARVHPFQIGGAEFTLIGGEAVDSAWLASIGGAAGLEAVLSLDGRPPAAIASAPLRLVDATGGPPVTGSAELRLVRTDDALEALQRRLDRWFLLVIAGTVALALALAAWLAARISAPIRELSAKTAALDLERLDQDFATDRTDEIGTLANLLDAMTRRLRTSTTRLREAERRAAVGDLSRQVNHDIRNGLAPIRHVVRHLAEVSERQPAELPVVFAERRDTLESSVAYLEGLAANYARLAPGTGRGATDVPQLLREIAGSLSSGRIAVETTAADLPRAAADPVSLRRIIENLAVNAVESIEAVHGTVTLAGEKGAEGRVRITVSDTGRGMTRAELERAFDDFHTTKPAGTGLGLSVVRRLVADLGGSLEVATEPGAGSRFTVELPAHDTQPGA
ncbi:MAG: ATP-binding protein [Gemmatimonadota bacterium]